jgi:hypothetical protein
MRRLSWLDGDAGVSVAADRRDFDFGFLTDR